jgi:PAS domain S-box-containing protein
VVLSLGQMNGQWVNVARVTDITQMRQQAEAARRSEAMLNAVFEINNDSLIVVDPMTNIVINCNTATVRALGYDHKDEIIGRNGNSFQQRGFTTYELKTIYLQLIQEGFWEAEIEYKRKNGETFWGHLAVTTGLLDGRQVAITRVADVSEQKHLRETLFQAKEAAEGAARAKTEFLSRMSHEIRTPLNAIIGLSNLMALDPPSATHENIVTVKQAGDSLLALVNDILDFSKLEADKIGLEKIAFRPREVLSLVAKTVEMTALAKGLRLTCTATDQVPGQLLGDPLRLQQVLLNLITNAVKFTEQGQVSLLATAQPAQPGHVKIEFKVTDTGIGVPDNLKNTIFEQFTQAEVGTSRKYGGTGLGLAIVKRLVELMQGQITVADNPGGGSVFKVSIPLETHYPNEQLSPVTTHYNPALHDLTGTKVLLAEDNKVNQFVAKQILGKWNVQVDVANHGQETIELLKANQGYCCILMDIQMPIMDGIAATRAIRAEVALPDAKRLIPIVALTADIMPDTREQVIAAGMNDVIIKPFELDELYALLKKYSEQLALS